MKSSFFYVTILILVTGCFGATNSVLAQNWDIDFVRNVNPMGEKSFVFRGLSSSVYPVSIAIPAAIFIDGKITGNKKLVKNSYEQIGSLAIAVASTFALKEIANRERPYEKYNGVYPQQFEYGHSFPSAHAALSFATATTLSLQYKKWYVVVPAYAWAASCSFSRIYLGEHYPTDVLAGAAIGAGSALLSRWITKKILH